MTPTTPHRGPYHLLGELGRGGMGQVFRARHRDTGQVVALKTLDVPRASMLGSIRREIRALAALSHPHVVRIVEHGLHQGLPWYAMELIEGPTLRELLPSAMGSAGTVTARTKVTEVVGAPLSSSPPPSSRAGLPFDASVQRALTHLIEVCEALAYLHGEGLVHADIKPANVVIRNTGAVLVDFGLSSSSVGGAGSSSVTSLRSAAGTPHYMSPEQIRDRRAPDPRSDLYAVGCVLYQTLTGIPPYDGESSAHIRRKHLYGRPEPIRRLSPEVPEPLAQLTLRLLAKRPEDRPAYAADVARALRAITGEPRAENLPRPRVYFYAPELVGRDAAVDALSLGLARLLKERVGGCFLVRGLSGVGKTRVLLEAIQLARSHGALIVSGSGAQGGAGVTVPLHPMRRVFETLADRCLEGGNTLFDALLGDTVAEILAPHAPAIAALPRTASLTPSTDAGVAGEARTRLYLALTHAVKGLAQREPVVLVLDDLHRADPLTLGWLELLVRTRAHESLPVLLLLGTDSGHLDSLSAATHTLDLGPLAPAEVERMAGSMLALNPVPPALVDVLVRQARGLPLWIYACIREAVEEGVLSRDGDRGAWTLVDAARLSELGLPEVLESRVASRVAGLAPGARRMLELLALAGREVAVERLEEVAAPEHIDALLDSGVIEWGHHGRLRLAHLRYGTLVLEPLTLEERAERHRVVAAWALDPLERGEHLERAGDVEDAREAFEESLALARAHSDFVASARALQALVRLTGRPSLRVELARIQIALGDTHMGLREAELARDALPEPAELQGEAELLVADAQHTLGELDAAVASVERSVARFEEAKRPGSVARARLLEAVLLSDRGAGEKARACAEEALAHFVEASDVQGQALAWDRLSWIQLGQGAYLAGRDTAYRALAAFRAVGDKMGEGRVLSNLAISYADLGEHDRAAALLNEALQVHRSLGNRRMEGIVLGNLAQMRDPEYVRLETLERFREALAIHREVGSRRSEGIGLSRIAIGLTQQGRLEEAREVAQRALAIHDELDFVQYTLFTELTLARIDRLEARLNGAEARLSVCERMLEERDDPYGAIMVACERGHLALAGGKSGGEALEHARLLLDALSGGARSSLGRIVARLEQACVQEVALLGGEVPESMTRALRKRLESPRL